jgi:hypothetical protein
MALDLSIQVHEFTLFSKNLLSAEQHKNEMLLKLQNEVKLGRILGTFKNMPISTLQISPIGLVPKPDGNWCLITNLSHKYCVNDKT